MAVRDAKGRFVGGGGRPGDRLLARLQEIAKLDGVTVTVGLQGRGAAAGESTDSELVVIGRAHEFGLGVPQRAWLRTALARNRKVWTGGLKTALRQVAQNGRAGVRTLRLVGVTMVSDVKSGIAAGPWHPNSPETIAAKGSDKPLIDTSQMLQSVRATVEGPGLSPELIG